MFSRKGTYPAIDPSPRRRLVHLLTDWRRVACRQGEVKGDLYATRSPLEVTCPRCKKAASHETFASGKAEGRRRIVPSRYTPPEPPSTGALAYAVSVAKGTAQKNAAIARLIEQISTTNTPDGDPIKHVEYVLPYRRTGHIYSTRTQTDEAEDAVAAWVDYVRKHPLEGRAGGTKTYEYSDDHLRIITLRDGSAWACDGEGRGVLSRTRFGSWRQLALIGQAGPFQTAAAFSRHVHANYRAQDGSPLPRMVDSRGWWKW